MKRITSIYLADCCCIQDIIVNRRPKGLFLCQEGLRWVAVDNSTGDAWTEDFSEKLEAVQWLTCMEQDSICKLEKIYVGDIQHFD